MVQVLGVMQSCICNHTSHVAEYVCPSATVLPLTGSFLCIHMGYLPKMCVIPDTFLAQGLLGINWLDVVIDFSSVLD